MSNDPAPTTHHTPKRIGPGGCMLGCFGVLAVVILVPVLSYLAWRHAAAKRVDDQLAGIRAKGQPTTYAELDASYVSPPEGKDATAIWVAAMAPISTAQFDQEARDLPIVGTSELSIPPPGQTWEQLDDVEALLLRYADSMEKLHEAARMGGAARYYLEFEDGMAMSLTHAHNIRAGARMLSLEAHVRAHKGDAKGAAESIKTCIMLARSLEKEPILVSQLVSIACHGIALVLVRDLVPHVDFSDEDLAELQQTLRSADFLDGMHLAMQGERVIGIHTIRNPRDLLDAEDRLPFGLLTRHEDLSLFIDLMTRLVDALERPWPEARKEADLINQELRDKISSPVNRLRYFLTPLVLPATEAVITAGARSDASRKATDTMIAVEQYRHRHGKVPETLGQLVPDFLPGIPIDPFDGKPIRYVVGENEVVIYSIGKDGIDDGGEGDDTM